MNDSLVFFVFSQCPFTSVQRPPAGIPNNMNAIQKQRQQQQMQHQPQVTHQQAPT